MFSNVFVWWWNQCDGNNGVCPDSRIGGRNDVSMLYGQRINGVTTVAYQRSLDAQQDKFDQVIPPVGRVNVIAAIGPLNSRKEANYHSTDRTGPQGMINWLTNGLGFIVLHLMFRGSPDWFYQPRSQSMPRSSSSRRQDQTTRFWRIIIFGNEHGERHSTVETERYIGQDGIKG